MGQLGLRKLKALGGLAAGGCISNGQSYDSDKGRIFVKYNEDHKVCGLWSVL